MFASPVFKRLLGGNFKEGTTLSQNGSVKVKAQGWDIDALLIVLYAIHGQYHLIPEKLTIEALAKVAVITDYYLCKKVLYIMAKTWINNLEGQVPATCGRDLMIWIWVSWYFRLCPDFELATSRAMSLSEYRINSLGLPIPGNIIGTVPILQPGVRFLLIRL